MKHLILIFTFLTALNLNAQWELCNGKPLEGFVNGVTFVDTSIYVCTDKGIYLSIDDGESWDLKNSGLDFKNVYTLKSNNDYLYAGTWGGGVYYSEADNINWKSCNFGLNDKYIYTIHSSDNKTFACTRNGIYSMSGNSCSWTLSGLKNNAVYSIIEYEDLLIAGTDGNGIFISSDKGENWVEKNTGLDDLNINALCLLNENIIAGTLSGIYFSSDKGNTWIEKNEGLTNFKIMSLEIHNQLIYASTFGGGVFYSTNQGEIWNEKNNGFTDLSIEKIAVNNDMILSISNKGKIYQWIDSTEKWSEVFKNITTVRIQYPFSLALDGDILLAGAWNSRFYTSFNHGKTWFDYGSITASYLLTLSVHNHTYYAGTMNDGVAISNDGGKSWIKKNYGLSTNKSKRQINSFAFQKGTTYIGIKNDGMYKSTDDGNFWNKIENEFSNYTVSKLYANENILIAGVYERDLYISYDFGNEWIKDKDNISISSIVMINNTIIVGSNYYGIHISSDYGKSWKWSSKGLSNTKVRCLTTVNNDIISTTDNGVFLSTDIGENWQDISTGLTSNQKNINQSVVNSKYIFISNSRGEIFRRKLSDVINSVGDEFIKSNDIALNIIPNPISDFTTFNIRIPNSFTNINISLSLYDILGNKIKHFSDIDFSPNQATLNWDGTDNYGNELPNGVYFLILQAGNSTLSKKIVISR